MHRNRTTACGNVYPLVLKHTRDTVTDALIFERLVFTEIRLVIHPVYRAIFIVLYPESEIFVVYRITAHIVDDTLLHIAVHGARHIRVKNTASHCHDKKYCQKSLIVILVRFSCKNDAYIAGEKCFLKEPCPTSRIISPVSLTHKSAAANIKSELSVS